MKSLQGEASRHVFKMRLQALILVDNDDRRTRFLALGPSGVGPDVTRFAGIGDVAYLEARVILRHEVAQGDVAPPSRQPGRGRRRPAGEQRHLLEESAAIQISLRQFVGCVDPGSST